MTTDRAVNGYLGDVVTADDGNVARRIVVRPEGAGPTPAATSTSVVPASGSPSFPVQMDGVADGAVSSASVSAAAVGATFSTIGYGSVTLQLLANPSGNTLLVEGSNDGGTSWNVIAFRYTDSTASTGAVQTTNRTVVGTAFIPIVVMPLMRWRVSGYVAGTTTVAVGLKRSSAIGAVDAFAAGTVTQATGATIQATGVGAMVFADTATPLGSSATFTGTARDTTSLTGSVTMFGASFTADQVGTAFIDYSTDNSTWVVAATVAVTAGTLAAGPTFDLNVRLRARYYRTRFINGAVAQGVFRAVSSFTAG